MTNYDAALLRKLFSDDCHDKDRDDCDFMGHSQTTYDPEDMEEEDAKSDNLFARFEQVADDKESQCGVMERKLHSFMSMYAALDKDQQSAADDRVDMLLSQTRSDYAESQRTTGGTRSVLVERHAKRSRTFNTHHSYYK